MQIQPGRFLYSRSERADLVRMLLADGATISDAARWLCNEFGMNLRDSGAEVLEVYRSEIMYAPRSRLLP